MTGLIDFSTDAVSNDTAAPPILWTEGQPASTVNNSSREVMAALARWRDDNAGALVASRGSGDAYGLATAQIFSAAAAAKAHTVSFSVSAPNQGPATLSIDGNTARPVLRRGGRQLAPGDLTTGIVYALRYVPGLSAYLIIAPAIERPGRIVMQADAAPDPGWVLANGQALSRTAYAALFAVHGTTYGAGDGTSTFNVPNFNGRTPFGPGLTGAGGIAAAIGSTGGAEAVALTADHLASHTHTGTASAAGGVAAGTTGTAGSHNHGGQTNTAGAHTHTGSTDSQGAHQHTATTDSQGSHTHPIQYVRQAAYNTGGSNTVATVGLKSAGVNSTDYTEPDGLHQHSLTTNASGAHSHSVGIASAGDHTHTIASDGGHTHSTPAIPDHTHALAINAAGNGAAHSNMPPGLVVAFVIKA